jgi:hypothetical protein
MIINYHCKFCGIKGSVELEEGDLESFSVKKWLAILCCNHCGSFYERKRCLEDAIKKQCGVLAQAMNTTSGNKLDKTKSSVNDALTSITKRYARTVCEHFKKRNEWEPDFVIQLMEQPDKWRTMCSFYVNTVGGISKQHTT